jgi:hypothetical protein
MPKAKVTVRERSEIVKRRLANPLGQPSVSIPLREPERWTLRVANSNAHAGRIAEMVTKGWAFVTAEDVAGTITDHGYELRDGRIVRGHRGEEVLMKMEREDFRDIQKAKAAQNITSTFGAKQMKDAILARAEKEDDGDRGADFLNRSLKAIEIHDSLERIPADER